MVSVKQATEKAIAFAQDALGTERTAGIRLEEVESTMVGNTDAWLITLSMVAPDQLLGSVIPGFSTPKREYKSFTVLKSNGDVRSMKIRELADA